MNNRTQLHKHNNNEIKSMKYRHKMSLKSQSTGTLKMHQALT